MVAQALNDEGRQFPTDALLLAAIDRADRHQATPARGDVPPGTWLMDIAAHLALDWHSATARRLRTQLDRLEDRGLVATTVHGRLTRWRLTETGTRRHQFLRAHGETDTLPESPQHRAWREARAGAAEAVTGLRRDLRSGLQEGRGMLALKEGPTSDQWFLLGEELRRACRRLGSATHCLREWAEPDDARRDADDRQAPGDEALAPAERRRAMALRWYRRTAWRDTP